LVNFAEPSQYTESGPDLWRNGRIQSFGNHETADKRRSSPSKEAFQEKNASDRQNWKRRSVKSTIRPSLSQPKLLD